MYASIQSSVHLKAPSPAARWSEFALAAVALFASNAVAFAASHFQRATNGLQAVLRRPQATSPERLALALDAARALGYAALPVDAGGVVALVMLRGHTRIVVLNERGRRMSERDLAYFQQHTDANAIWFLDELVQAPRPAAAAVEASARA